MLFLGRIIDWTALIAVIMSTGLYLIANTRPRADRKRWSLAGRACFIVATLCVIAAVVDLGTLLVTHRFDSDYVYSHSARAMDPLYYFPSLWAGQEGSFMLWAFWTGILGIILACTARAGENKVMPIYNGILIFLASMLVIRSPFLPLDTHGLPIPTEGLGLNPNLENPWMVIHPPTLFLGLSSLGVPFAYALAGLFWRDWTGWMRRAIPWALFGFSLLGLAMMMGGYWAYEMLGWGGFWGSEPVENGPLIPWLFLVAFLHTSQVQRVRDGLLGTTLTFAMLPFIAGLYETFLTRTGILDKFSVHSFSTLGGIGNAVLLYVLLGSLALAILSLLWRRKDFKSNASVWEHPGSREFGYVMAALLITLVALISTIGMSAPLITALGVKLHLTDHVASIKEDFYNHANFPIAVLLAIGMAVTPYLTWRRSDANMQKLVPFYAASVICAVLFTIVRVFVGSAVFGGMLAAQILLFTCAMFALIANGNLLLQKFRIRGKSPDARTLGTHAITAGGVVSHIGVAVFLIGVVCLVTFVRKNAAVEFPQGQSVPVFNGAYTMTYLGQTGNFQTDRHNALRILVQSHDKRETYEARLPFALRSIEGGDKLLFGHPSITHHISGDLYLAVVDGPDLSYRTPVYRPNIALGGVGSVGPYKLQLVRFDRDPAAAAYVAQTGQMPPTFPVTAVLNVTYHGVTSVVKPMFVVHADNPNMPDTPEVKLPDGWLVSFQSMNAGSADSNDPAAGAMGEGATFALREDSGPPTEVFYLDVTTRPMINLVWVGTLLLVIGGFLSMRRRILENRAVIDEEPETARKEPTGAKTKNCRRAPASPIPGAVSSMSGEKVTAASSGKMNT